MRRRSPRHPPLLGVIVGLPCQPRRRRMSTERPDTASCLRRSSVVPLHVFLPPAPPDRSTPLCCTSRRRRRALRPRPSAPPASPPSAPAGVVTSVCIIPATPAAPLPAVTYHVLQRHPRLVVEHRDRRALAAAVASGPRRSRSRATTVPPAVLASVSGTTSGAGRELRLHRSPRRPTPRRSRAHRRASTRLVHRHRLRVRRPPRARVDRLRRPPRHPVAERLERHRLSSPCRS